LSDLQKAMHFSRSLIFTLQKTQKKYGSTFVISTKSHALFAFLDLHFTKNAEEIRFYLCQLYKKPCTFRVPWSSLYEKHRRNMVLPLSSLLKAMHFSRSLIFTLRKTQKKYGSAFVRSTKSHALFAFLDLHFKKNTEEIRFYFCQLYKNPCTFRVPWSSL